jgi:hypothetical protein
MQNVQLGAAIATGQLYAGYNSSVLRGFVDLQDFSTVARLILLNTAIHARARYELVGCNSTLDDVARDVATVTGREVNCVPVPMEQMIDIIVKSKGAETKHEKEMIERMLFYYDKRCVHDIRWTTVYSQQLIRTQRSDRQLERPSLASRPRAYYVERLSRANYEKGSLNVYTLYLTSFQCHIRHSDVHVRRPSGRWRFPLAKLSHNRDQAMGLGFCEGRVVRVKECRPFIIVRGDTYGKRVWSQRGSLQGYS